MVDPATPHAEARPRGRRPKTLPDGRQALIRAGITAFASVGFEAADVRSIAAAADVSPNLVRVHFGSKADLWVACLDAVVKIVEPARTAIGHLATTPEISTYERLRRVIEATAAFYLAHPHIRDFAGRYRVETNERVAMVTERLLRPVYETAKEPFAAGIAEGIIRADHPALFFTLLNAALNPPATFPTLLHRLAPEIDPDTARARMAETMIATLLHRPA